MAGSRNDKGKAVIVSVDPGLPLAGVSSAPLRRRAQPRTGGVSGRGEGLLPTPPFLMLIHCWNVRGLNSPLKQHEVVNLMWEHKLDVCCFLETKLVSSKVSSMRQFRLKNWKVLSNAAAASTARIVVF